MPRRRKRRAREREREKDVRSTCSVRMRSSKRSTAAAGNRPLSWARWYFTESAHRRRDELDETASERRRHQRGETARANRLRPKLAMHVRTLEHGHEHCPGVDCSGVCTAGSQAGVHLLLHTVPKTTRRCCKSPLISSSFVIALQACGWSKSIPPQRQRQ
jgi:hypothetical protein